jgi:hypothetical protein
VKRVEPSLLRSVLILNTLKHIEVELQNDGVQTSGADSRIIIKRILAIHRPASHVLVMVSVQ